ncbi:phytoene/squalene synthase family protein [Candidatus Micrarchaeota archaeon]|nr:phytoene/squalene synthase family protein [Candidatus Micrarchaeota archaeon]
MQPKPTTVSNVDFTYATESIKKGSKTFYFASRFMSLERRNAFYAIYAFCRHTDNLIDDNEGKPELQKMLIKDWKKRFLQSYRKNNGNEENKETQVLDQIITPFVYVMKKYNIPLKYALELIRGVSMDIEKKEYSTFKDLRAYCYRVASVVGLMLSYVMGIENVKRSRKYAIKLGIAMQLTNILRDVGEDARMGRVYFPKDELERFGLTVEDILALKKTNQLIEFLRFQIARARRYYHEALRGIAMIHKEVRLVISMAFSLYQEILTVIEENKYEVYGKRAYVNTLRKVGIYLKIMAFGVIENPQIIPQKRHQQTELG